MKKFVYSILLSVPLFTLWFCTSSSGVKDKEFVNNTKAKMLITDFKNVAVLELFTSQGCSSCPSADRLLEKYSSKENVITLSFHVDYWNRLGWTDPFSLPENTKRQYKYSSALNSSVYTPQLIVNGESELVGSDAKKLGNTLKKIWSQNSNSEVTIENANVENGKAVINFNVNGNSDNSVLNIALVEKKTVTSIRAGENSGISLSGTNVVRNFKSISSLNDGRNTSVIEIPDGINQKNMSVILYLQENNNKIVAADQADL